MNYQARRSLAKEGMCQTQKVVEEVLKMKPEYRNLGVDPTGMHYINKLIRYIWKNYKDYNARSIIRFYSEVMKNHPEWDTAHNAENRANAQTAYQERFNLTIPTYE